MYNLNFKTLERVSFYYIKIKRRDDYMKIKLVNGTVLEVENIVPKNDLIVISIMNSNLTDLRTLFDNKINLSTIEVLTENDVVCGVYNGYKKVDSYVIKPEIETDIIVITLTKPTETEERLTAAEDWGYYNV